MKISISLMAAMVVSASHPISEEMVREIRSKATTWEAMDPAKNPLSKASKEEIMGLMGTILSPMTDEQKSSFRTNHSTMVGFPESFDARSQFGSCMHPIRDQAKCGSCWAFGAAETLSDNLCVSGSSVGVLAPQDLVSCDSVDHGCEGGTLTSAWDYLVNTGIVSDSCFPYTAFNGTVDKCPGYSCPGSGSWTKHKCPGAANFLSAENDIKQGVISLGSAETGFYVYEDFLSYKGGVYKHTTGQVLGGHAVKIMGWGVASGSEYWIVANSWGTGWGESGYFRIDMHDHDSAFALGGAFNCGPLTPQQPTPAPPTPEPKCQDILSPDKCQGFKDNCAKAIYMECMETCGCCKTYNKPDYCP